MEYSIFKEPENPSYVLKKAEYLMNFEQYEEALQTLLSINNSSLDSSQREDYKETMLRLSLHRSDFETAHSILLDKVTNPTICSLEELVLYASISYWTQDTLDFKTYYSVAQARCTGLPAESTFIALLEKSNPKATEKEPRNNIPGFSQISNGKWLSGTAAIGFQLLAIGLPVFMVSQQLYISSTAFGYWLISSGLAGNKRQAKRLQKIKLIEEKTKALKLINEYISICN